VWKDELVIYIPPSGVIPVFSFLKCMPHVKPRLHFRTLILHRQHICRIHANLGHYCCRFPHSRPAIWGRLQLIECPTQLKNSSQDVCRRSVTSSKHHKPVRWSKLVWTRGVWSFRCLLHRASWFTTYHDRLRLWWPSTPKGFPIDRLHGNSIWRGEEAHCGRTVRVNTGLSKLWGWHCSVGGMYLVHKK